MVGKNFQEKGYFYNAILRTAPAGLLLETSIGWHTAKKNCEVHTNDSLKK